MNRILVMAALLTGLTACSGHRPSDDAGNAANQTVPPETVHFVNSPANAVSESLRRAYVDFAFDYPSDWSVTPPRTDGTERNFVRVAAPEINGFEPASFLVGVAVGSGDAERDRGDIERALPQIARGFGANLRDYRVASTGRARVGPYRSWNWRFSATAPGEDGPAARMSGRGDIVLPPGAQRGVLIISLVTDRSDEMSAPERVGEAGKLKRIYDSFRLGTSGSAR